MNELPNTEGLGMKVRTFQVLCFIVAAGLIAVGLVAIHSNATEDTLSATPNAIATANIDEQPPPSLAPSAMSDALPQRESLLSNDQKADFDAQEQKADVDSQERHEAKLEDSLQEYPSDSTLRKQDFSYLAYYAYAEVLPDKKPADTVLEALKGIPVGAPVEEIKRVSDAFGLDFVFMRAVAKIESDFDPKQRTGSYIGLFPTQ